MNDRVTRRQFVQAAAAGLVVPAALAPVRSARAAAPLPRTLGRPFGSDEIKIGLIGCGGRGTGAAVQALNADPGCVLHAVGDVFPERIESSLRGIRGEMGDNASSKVKVDDDRRFLGFDAYQKVIASGVDVVLLTTPPHFRPIHLEAAVGAGKHIFCEKPMAVDSPGLRSVVASAAAAKEKGLSLVAGFCWRYGDAERAAFDQVNGGAVGDIVTVHTTYHTGTLSQRPRQPEWSDMEWQLRNWWHFTWLSGDHIVEQAVHSIDRLAWATGDRDPVRATALGGRQARTGAESGYVYDHFAVVYEYADGTRAFHTCRQIDGCPSDNTDYIYGTRGSCTVNGWTPLHVVKDLAGKTVWSYEGPRRDMYQNEHDVLFRSIRDGSAHNDGDRMCRSNLMAIMGRMAAYTGQTVTWEQAMNSTQDLSPPEYGWVSLPVPPVAIPGRTKLT
ncbi:MAG: Gfo/Idh/MocA family oxidoreductase [Phycisphaerales bacterium]|nr:Gfo/Idh/MocA family oxidoreductase [Phycisphaerales bacterium]